LSTLDGAIQKPVPPWYHREVVHVAQVYNNTTVAR